MSMLTKTVEVEYRGRWGLETHNERRLTLFSKVVLGLAGLGAAYFGMADKGLDMMGDKAKPIPLAEITKNGVQRYENIYRKASPAGKFVLQYGAVASVFVYGSRGGIGLAGAFSDDNDREIVINNGCLKNTAYDVNGGQIRGEFRGLFSSGHVDGDVPTAAADAQLQEGGRLVIRSGNANSIDLHFSNINDSDGMRPADDATRNILRTYGCEVGIQRVRDTDSLYGEYVTLE